MGVCIENGNFFFWKMGVCFSNIGVCFTKMDVCFTKNGSSFFGNRSLFPMESGSGSLKNASLFHKNGLILQP